MMQPVSAWALPARSSQRVADLLFVPKWEHEWTCAYYETNTLDEITTLALRARVRRLLCPARRLPC